IKTSSIAIYPNPATDNIYITLPENVRSAFFTLYDLQGKELIKQEVSNQDRVAVNGLASGIYIYKIKTNKQSYQDKLRINNK
ncbi:MAG: T9SS type A sorting domain-containing protein, partial [Bacteroidales bacterium]|nr:T9SS type A sorting domain-containing protein [Bacteroidales bacterium]